jgi:hypothetical protein
LLLYIIVDKWTLPELAQDLETFAEEEAGLANAIADRGRPADVAKPADAQHSGSGCRRYR